jgi:biotin transport system substrate-specific component
VAISTAAYPTLISAIWPEEESSKIARNVVLAILGTALLTISAKIQVPFYPVPMTMQTFVVLVIGMAYGWRLGGATVLLYLAEGAAGLPVFAAGGGFAYLAGPTAGYLVGFLAAAVAIGWLAERGWDRSVITAALAMLVGNVVLYIPGLLWLGTLFGWDKPILEWGLIPFIPGDVLKLALVAASLPLAWKLLAKRG